MDVKQRLRVIESAEVFPPETRIQSLSEGEGVYRGYRDNGKQNGNYRNSRGLYRDNAKENGKHKDARGFSGGYIGIHEKKMETIGIIGGCVGFIGDIYIYTPTGYIRIMEKNMETVRIVGDYIGVK